MSDNQFVVNQVREIVAQADAHRSRAAAAESARLKIRANKQPVEMRNGLLRICKWKRDDVYHHAADVEFTLEETTAIYEMLGQYREERLKHARELEQKLTLVQDGKRLSN